MNKTKITYRIKKIIPANLLNMIRPTYHYLLALSGAVIYDFPSRKINIIAITGTKGKTSCVEIIGAILDEAGYKTALASTLRFKIGNESENNLFKMTMPGRFFLQRFLRRAVKENCNYAVIEMTSEGAKQFRHKFISLNSLIFTNLAPEHIESHGSFEKYLEAKLKIAGSLEKSNKEKRVIVVNVDDEYGQRFLNINTPDKYAYSLKDAEPYQIFNEGLEFTFRGEKIKSALSGKFNLYNLLAGCTYALSQNISLEIIKRAVENFKGIRGRVEKIEEGQNFTVIVDYAHTPDSLEKLYEVFQNSKRICVLGNTGGGRDKWKRKEMAKIAERLCDQIILTNEDPYDENPMDIINQMVSEIKETPLEIIIDRRQAINKALSVAQKDDSVLITGKGTDPYIMGPKGSKIKWSDAEVCRGELKKILKK